MRKGRTLLIAIIVILVSAIAAGIWAYNAFISDSVANEGSVYVPTGADYPELLDSLRANERIKDINKFDAAAKILGLAEGVRPGHYMLKKGTSYKDAARMFQRGFQKPVRVTFNNQRTLSQLAGKIAAQLEPDSVTIAAALLSDTTAARYGFTPRTFISMFIPNTYELYWNTPVVGFTDRMKTEYDRFWTEERNQKLSRSGLSQTEAITLASIVYEETKMSDEMPVVAGVYINRLRKGMPLQADPTVKFAIGDFTLRRVLNRHLEVDSPYNTYKYSGLPPGPIAMPSVTAIDAVLHFKEHNYLFFCAKPDFSGYHNFAATLAEHNRNVQTYHRFLNQQGIR